MREELKYFLNVNDRTISMLRQQKQYLAFLGQPYSDPSVAVRQQRYRSAVIASSWLQMHGIPVYSPIVHCHPMIVTTALLHDYQKKSDFERWEDLNRRHITRSHELIILQLEGWEKSVGLFGDDEHDGEVPFAESINIPVTKLPQIYEEDLIHEPGSI